MCGDELFVQWVLTCLFVQEILVHPWLKIIDTPLALPRPSEDSPGGSVCVCVLVALHVTLSCMILQINVVVRI